MNIKLYDTPRFGEYSTSFFKGVTDCNPQPLGWEHFYRVITSSPKLRQITELARRFYHQGDKENYAQYKGRGGAITPAAFMQGGHKAENIVGLTAVAMVDIDKIAGCLDAARQAVMSDPHTMLCHITPSGEGLRILARYRSDKHQIAYHDAWLTANEYYALITHCDYDRSTKDPSRLSFLAYDPGASLNLQSTPFVIGSEGDKPSAEGTDDPFAEAERIADGKGIAFVEGGRHHCLLYRTALLNKMGVAQADALDYVRRNAPRGDREADGIVDYVYGRNAAEHGTWKHAAQRLRKGAAKGATPSAQTDKKGILASDIEAYLREHAGMRYNTIGQRVEVLDGATGEFENLTEQRLNSIWRDIERHFGRKVNRNDVHGVICSDSTPYFDPVREYFDALEPWNPGQPDYIGQLAATVHTTSDPELFATCFKKWLVAVFAPLLGSTAPNHTILVLVGPQGRYKSTFCEFLLPPELRTYFKCKTNQGRMSKDDRIDLCSNIIIEIAELDSMNDRELNQLKALTTAQSINERAPYAHVAESRPHICSFCATGNHKQFLTDLTGNRRFLPFEVEHIDSPREHPFDYGHIYAQVLYLLQNGFEYWFDADDPAMAAHCQQFMVPMPEEELLLRHFRKPSVDGAIPECGKWMSSSELTEVCNVHSRLLLDGRKIAKLMQKHGFESKRAACGQVYLVMQRVPEEITTEQLDTNP